MVAKITNYGGIVTSLLAHGKNGKLEDVVLGFDNLAGYTAPEYVNSIPYFGALIGRYGNRIGDAKFEIDGQMSQLDVNNGKNHLHGGKMGFHAVVWDAETEVTANGPQLKLTYLSKDGEMGYPGNCTVKATYTLTSDNALKVEFEAETDKPTHVNLTQHSYFNLSGCKNNILTHELMIKAGKYTPVDEGLIPTGVIDSVTVALDFTVFKPIGKDIDDP